MKNNLVDVLPAYLQLVRFGVLMQPSAWNKHVLVYAKQCFTSVSTLAADSLIMLWSTLTSQRWRL